MAVIETKFGVGDIAYHASIHIEQKEHPCPDCLGSREWEARSPAGGVFVTPCPRCTSNYLSNRDLNLKYSQWTPTARRLTIGQVRAFAGSGGEHEYMAVETGIGSGSLYSESSLFATEAEALACATARAAVNNADATGWVAKQFSETARFCDYQLSDVTIKSEVERARRARWQCDYLIDDLGHAETMEEVREAVATWQDRREELPEPHAPADGEAIGPSSNAEPVSSPGMNPLSQEQEQ